MSGDFGTASRPSRSRFGLRAVRVPVPRRADLDVPIETKFHAPGLHRGWVERAYLIQRMVAAAAAKLILVDAPAGFGKTTLVAQWLAAGWRAVHPPGSRWMTARMNPALWWHIMHALQEACPGLTAEEVPRELLAQDPDITGTVLPALLNELAGLNVPVVLVLHDYQAITEPSCHEQIAFFLLHLPPSAQVVLITRTSPPLPLARLRAAGEMIELGARELRFSQGRRPCWSR